MNFNTLIQNVETAPNMLTVQRAIQDATFQYIPKGLPCASLIGSNQQSEIVKSYLELNKEALIEDIKVILSYVPERLHSTIMYKQYAEQYLS